VDGEARIDETRGGLQDGGADIDAVVAHLVHAMNLALATEDDVRGLIYNPQGLETKYENHLRAAVDEYNGWVRALNEAVAAQSDFIEGLGLWVTAGMSPRGVGEPVPPSLTHPTTGESRLAVLTSSGWALPDDLAGTIRNKYLQLAATDAGATADDIEAEIERYRRLMAERADELRRLGHDVSAGPLGLWDNDQGMTDGTGQQTPQGLTPEQFADAARTVREGAGHLGEDIVVHGSRADGTARPDSDIDFAIRVPPDRFDELIRERFGTPNPGSAKEGTMLWAMDTGKIQAGEAGVRGIRRALEAQLGMEVDLSVVRQGGPFDTPPFIEVPDNG
jgi:hypothetical protein